MTGGRASVPFLLSFPPPRNPPPNLTSLRRVESQIMRPMPAGSLPSSLPVRYVAPPASSAQHVPVPGGQRPDQCYGAGRHLYGVVVPMTRFRPAGRAVAGGGGNSPPVTRPTPQTTTSHCRPPSRPPAAVITRYTRNVLSRNVLTAANVVQR